MGHSRRTMENDDLFISDWRRVIPSIVELGKPRRVWRIRSVGNHDVRWTPTDSHAFSREGASSCSIRRAVTIRTSRPVFIITLNWSQTCGLHTRYRITSGVIILRRTGGRAFPAVAIARYCDRRTTKRPRAAARLGVGWTTSVFIRAPRFHIDVVEPVTWDVTNISDAPASRTRISAFERSVVSEKHARLSSIPRTRSLVVRLHC